MCVIGVSHGTGSWNGTACCMRRVRAGSRRSLLPLELHGRVIFAVAALDLDAGLQRHDDPLDLDLVLTAGEADLARHNPPG